MDKKKILAILVFIFFGFSLISSTGPRGEIYNPDTIVDKYTVKFVDYNNKLISSQKVEKNGNAKLPKNPTRVGYTFDGWVGKYKNITKDETVKATYKINSYKLTIDYIYEDETKAYESKELVLNYNKDYKVESPIITGYTADNMIVEGKMPAKNTTIKVIYRANTDTRYTINYYQKNINVNTYTLVDTEILAGTTNSIITLDETTLNNKYTGFILNKEKSTLTGKVEVDGSLVLNVYYNRKTFDVVIDPNCEGTTCDRSDDDKRPDIEYGDEILLPRKQRKYTLTYKEIDGLVDKLGSRTVYATFIGYCKNTKTCETKIPAGMVTVEEDVIYYAQFTETPEITIEKGNDYITSKIDYTFIKWSKYNVNEKVILTQDEEIIAQYDESAHPYNLTVNFNYYDGSIAHPKVETTIGYNEPYAVTIPTIAGYTPDINEIGGIMPEHDLVIDVTYNPNRDTKYKIEYYTENLNSDNYTKVKEENKTGTTNTEVSVDLDKLKIDYPGFTLNKEHENSNLKGYIAGDGSLVLKAYLNRNVYDIVIDPNCEGNACGHSEDETTPVVDPNKEPITEPHEYGEKIYLPTRSRQYILTFIEHDLVNPKQENKTVVLEFIGYCKDSKTCNTDEIIKTTTLVEVTADARYYAQFKPAESLPLNKGNNYEIEEGYIQEFTHWEEGLVSYNAPTTIVLERDVTLTAKYRKTPKTNTPYTVNHFKKVLNSDIYETTPFEVESLTGTTDTNVAATPKTVTGYHLNATKSVLTGKVKADGSLVLNLYYDQDTFDVIIDPVCEGKVCDTSDDDSHEDLEYGDKIILPRKTRSYTLTYSENSNVITKQSPVTVTAIAIGYCKNTPTCTTKIPVGTEVTVEDDVRYYAQYQETPKIKIASGNGYETPTEDFNFIGWSKYSVNELVTLHDNETITASYEKYRNHPYTLTITYKFEDGYKVDRQETKEVKYSEEYNIITPEVKGYVPDKDKVEGTMPADDVSVVVTYSPRHNMPYTIIRYTQNLNGTYSRYDSIYRNDGTTNTKVKYVLQDNIPGFYPREEYVEETIKPEGETILNAYYNRSTYTATFKINDKVCSTKDYKYEENVTVPAECTPRLGYELTSWKPSLPGTMPARNETYIALEVAVDSNYKIEYYTEDLNSDNYTKVNEENKAGKTDTKATVDLEEVKANYPGFTLNNTHENSKLEGIITGDGSLVLKVYLNRNSYPVIIDPNCTGNTCGQPENPREEQEVEYETEITLMPKTRKYILTYNENSDLKLGSEDAQLTFLGYCENKTTCTEDELIKVPEAGKKVKIVKETIFYAQFSSAKPIKIKKGYDYETSKYKYTFNKWQEEGYIVGQDVTLTENKEIHAQYNVTNQQYTVTFKIDGKVCGQPTKYAYLEQVTVPEACVAKAGYTLTPWNPLVDLMPDHDIEYNATNVANNNTSYKVERYIEKLDGTYELYDDKNLTGETDQIVEYVLENNITGFTPKTEKVSGVIKGDGSLILRAEYKRNSYTLTINYVISNTSLKPASHVKNYKFEESYEVVSPEITGYTVDIAKVYGNMPAEDKTVTVTYTANTDVSYIVKYLEKDTNKELHTEKTVSGKTFDATYTENAEVITGYTVDESTKDITLDAYNKELVFYYTANTDTKVSVQIWIENLENNEYSKLGDLIELFGTTKTEYTYTLNPMTGFTPAKPSYSKTIEADGSTVIDVYYNRNRYNVTFVDYNNTELKKETVKYQGNATAPTDPTRLGYNFTGWNGTYTSVTKDEKVVAQYTPITYIITYNLYDGTTNDTLKTTYTIEDSFDLTQNVTKVGYDFTGWTIDSTLVTKIENRTGNLVIDANYEASKNTKVTIKILEENTNDDEYTLVDTKEDKGTTGETYTYTLPERPGFTHTDEVVSDIVKADGTLVLEARYQRKRYTVTFVDYDNSLISKVENVKHGANATKPANPSRTGYTFTGWDKSCENITSNLTIKAQYAINQYSYTVNYYIDGVFEESDTKNKANYGAEINSANFNNKNYENTDLYDIKPTTLTITENETNNVINVYYARRNVKVTIQTIKGDDVVDNSTIYKYGDKITYNITVKNEGALDTTATIKIKELADALGVIIVPTDKPGNEDVANELKTSGHQVSVEAGKQITFSVYFEVIGNAGQSATLKPVYMIKDSTNEINAIPELQIITVEKTINIVEKVDVNKGANVIVVLDQSASMSKGKNETEGKLDKAKKAIIEFINDIYSSENVNVNMQVVRFGTTSGWGGHTPYASEVGNLTTKKSETNALINAINNVKDTSNCGTPYYKALEKAYELLYGTNGNSGLAKTYNKNENIVIFLSDGAPDDTDNETSRTNQINKLKNKGTKVYAIGYDIENNQTAKNVLKTVAVNGEVYEASVDGLKEVFAALKEKVNAAVGHDTISGKVSDISNNLIIDNNHKFEVNVTKLDGTVNNLVFVDYNDETLKQILKKDDSNKYYIDATYFEAGDKITITYYAPQA